MPLRVTAVPPVVGPRFGVTAVNVGVLTHTLLKQVLLAQSASTLQTLVTAHLVAHEPPQSTSVSVPFLTTSVQVGTAHLLAVQTPLVQSAATPHAWRKYRHRSPRRTPRHF